MRFSVIIPVYNVEKYLDECVHSVLAQDFQDYEMILVNDGSTDNSGEKCDAYAEKYSHIKVVHKENGGLSDARNFGVEEAVGEYLIFLDSDDFWGIKEALGDINRIISNKNNPDIIFFGHTDYFGEETPLSNYPFYEVKEGGFQQNFKYLLEANIFFVSAWNKVIKREIVINHKLYFPKGKIHEDIAWCYDIMPFINTYEVYPKSFYFYRKNNTTSISYTITDRSIMNIIDIISERADVNNTYDKNFFLANRAYDFVIVRVFSLSQEYLNDYIEKVIEMKFLLDFYPKNMSFLPKTRLVMYKFLGIKFMGKLEYNIRKSLNKL